MRIPSYITIRQARVVLSDMGIALSDRQMKRAAEPDMHGKRKLPFFKDPIDGKLKIEKGTLVRIYQELQISAENNYGPKK
jgi:hypothetical protein